RLFALHARAAVAVVTEADQLVAAAEENHLANFFRQLAERRVDVEFVMTRERFEHLKIERVASIPTANRAGRQRQRRVADHARGIEELARAQSIAARAGAGRIIEREQTRFEFAQRIAAVRAGVTRREN